MQASQWTTEIIVICAIAALASLVLGYVVAALRQGRQLSRLTAELEQAEQAQASAVAASATLGGQLKAAEARSQELQVAEKYLVGLLCTAVSAALNGIFCGIRFWMGKPLPAMPIGLLLGAGAASILLINGIMLPLYYRFGAEKARMLYMLMFAGMGAALGGGMVLMDAVPEPGAAIAIVGVLAAVLALYAVSWRVSVAWYGKYKK